MGDRHNIGLLQRDHNGNAEEIIWLYSHSGFWVGEIEGFAACLALALDEARPRWDDSSYFNRIVILTLGDSVRGINVGTCILDEHKRYVVDSENQQVMVMDNWSWDGSLDKMPEPIVTFTFEDFISKYRRHDKTVRNEY